MCRLGLIPSSSWRPRKLRKGLPLGACLSPFTSAKCPLHQVTQMTRMVCVIWLCTWSWSAMFDARLITPVNCNQHKVQKRQNDARVKLSSVLLYCAVCVTCAVSAVALVCAQFFFRRHGLLWPLSHWSWSFCFCKIVQHTFSCSLFVKLLFL